VLREADRREEEAVRRGCNHPEELRKAAGDLEGHHTGCEGHRIDLEGRHRETAGLVVLRTGTVVQGEQRKEIAVREGHHMERAQVVHRKETGRGVHHREKEQGVRRRATEQEAVHRKAIVQEVVLPGEKEGHHIGLKEDGQKAWELEEEEEHYLRSRSLKHPLCQSLEQSPWACQTPWASRPPWACRRQ